jgi:replicative DNA helicase
MSKVNDALDKVSGLPMHTVHTVKGPDDLASKARYLVRKHGVKFIVIDYLQLIPWSSKANSKSEGIADISHKIKQIALELNVGILLLSQVNREGAKRETGLSLYDLKDSGDIENDADIVLLLWPKNGDVEGAKDVDGSGPFTNLQYNIAKNREGERGIGGYLKFYHCYGRFV